MKNEFHPYGYNYKDQFDSLSIVKKLEGTVIHQGIRAEKFFLIIDSGTLADILDKDDTLLNKLIQIIEFESEDELKSYIEGKYGKLR